MRSPRQIFTAIALVVLLSAGNGSAIAAETFPVLRHSHDLGLQRTLDGVVKSLKLKRVAARGALALAVVDITDLHHPRLAQVNGNHMMYAASLPKIGILLAALHQVEQGELPYSNGLRRSLIEMIRVSSNVEATRMMNLVGKHRVNAILASPRYRLYDPHTNGGLWVGKEYGKRPAFARDPLHNISHGATALQVARFYYLLESGRLLGPQLSAAMKDALSRPAIEHKFVKGLKDSNVEIYRKSGTWRQWHADSAIIESPRGRYILVGMVEHKRGGEWLSRIAATLHQRLYPSQIARH